MTFAIPHAIGYAHCDGCDHRWEATWALGAENLQCPACGDDDTDREQVGGFNLTPPSSPRGGAPAQAHA